MKLTEQNFRQIIRREISRVLAESASESGAARSWLGVMKRSGENMKDILANVWDDMVATVNFEDDLDIKERSEDIAAGKDLDVRAISYHLRRLQSDMSAGVMIPSGSDLLEKLRADEDAAAAAKSEYDPEEAERSWNAAHPNRGWRST